MCYLCLRTGVTHVPGLYNCRGRRVFIVTDGLLPKFLRLKGKRVWLRQGLDKSANH
jgi:hypothetical protein